MERIVAEQIVSILLKASQEIEGTIDLYRPHANDADAKRYLDAVGEVMLALHGVLHPIWTQYPDLRPWKD